MEPTMAIHRDDLKTMENLLPTFPDHIQTLSDAVATRLAADALNVPFILSIGDLMVINGNVGMTSKLMCNLVHRAGHRIDVEISPTIATAVTSRKYDGKWEKTGEFTFTQEDAERANLWNKDTYQMYPADMLGHKVVARAVRFAFPDVLMGYIPDELEEFTELEAEFVAFDGDATMVVDGDDMSEALAVAEIAEVLDATLIEE